MFLNTNTHTYIVRVHHYINTCALMQVGHSIINFKSRVSGIEWLISLSSLIHPLPPYAGKKSQYISNRWLSGHLIQFGHNCQKKSLFLRPII